MSQLEYLEKFSKKINGKLIFNYNLKKSNWFNIGGIAKAYFKPDGLSELISFIKKFQHYERIFIIGAGSNILIKDDFFDGVVIKLGKNFSNISILPNKTIIAGSAATDKQLSDFAYENSIEGFEFLSCIPGTVGGGLRMNSGCFKKEFKDILVSVQAIDKKGNVLTIPASKIKFDYRNNDLDKGLIFLSASFQGKSGDKEKIMECIKTFKEKKAKTQPTKIKTGGSTFKNPIEQTDKKVWELIKDSVPLDTSFGDAKISEKHSNFFVNTNNASFEEMYSLIQFVRQNVKSKTGILLETEVEIIK